MKFLIAAATVLLFSATANAQIGHWQAGRGRVVTPPSGYRWVNPYPYGYNRYYHYRYRYEYGPRVRKAPNPRLYSGVDAWANDIRARWALEDEAKKRKEELAQERRAKAAERRKNRPKGEKGYFVHKGVKYESVKDFQKTEAYAQMIAEGRRRAEISKLEDEVKELRRQEAVRSEATRRLYNRPMIFLQEEARQRAIYNRAMQKLQ